MPHRNAIKKYIKFIPYCTVSITDYLLDAFLDKTNGFLLASITHL